MGSRGPDVVALQNGLNARLRPSPNLTPDGAYGPRTRGAVMQLQRENWLVVDGEAGACTQACALGTEAYPPILHNVPLIAQPTGTTCWATSTAMMINSTVPAVISRTPAEMIASDGGLKNWSETDQALPRGQAYGRIHGLRCNAPQSYMVSAMVGMLRRGPLMWDMLWDTVGYLTPDAAFPGEYLGSSGHMIVVIGVRGDGNPDGSGTTLRVNDPWPPNQGATYSVGYAKWMREVPTRTYRVFER
jgi:peptidoglycan hydrolase-like protein with peptidoglycan-binding domain